MRPEERSQPQVPTLKRLGRYAGVIHYAAGRHPALFYPLYRMRNPRRTAIAPHPVRRDTEIVIEGFPRSGNTFALLAFRLAQPREVVTADHLHVAAQIIRAARYGIPACVLVRDPEDAVRSLVVKYPFIRAKDALRGYASFYRACMRYRDHLVIARFEEVTQDFGAVIDRINARFGTGFARFEHGPRNVRRVFALLDARNRALRGDERSLARPTALKEDLKRRIDLADCARHLARCREVYAAFTSLAPGRAALGAEQRDDRAIAAGARAGPIFRAS